MKRYLLVLALIFSLNVMANEEIVTLNGIEEPEWKDFVPTSFVNVTEPKGLGKLNETATYWYQRKTEFEEAIYNCRNLDDVDAQFSCYQEIKIKQYQKNSEYNAKIEAQERARMCPEEMYDRTNNMIPVGGYINNLMNFQQNEFR